MRALNGPTRRRDESRNSHVADADLNQDEDERRIEKQKGIRQNALACAYWPLLGKCPKQVRIHTLTLHPDHRRHVPARRDPAK